MLFLGQFTSLALTLFFPCFRSQAIAFGSQKRKSEKVTQLPFGPLPSKAWCRKGSHCPRNRNNELATRQLASNKTGSPYFLSIFAALNKLTPMTAILPTSSVRSKA